MEPSNFEQEFYISWAGCTSKSSATNHVDAIIMIVSKISQEQVFLILDKWRKDHIFFVVAKIKWGNIYYEGPFYFHFNNLHKSSIHLYFFELLTYLLT